MQCTYCKVKQENKKICSFCEADLTQERHKKKQTLSQEEAYQTQPELSKYHTYDLLLLLSYLREQRSTAYNTMQSVRKAPNEVKTSRNDYDELNEYGQIGRASCRERAKYKRVTAYRKQEHEDDR